MIASIRSTRTASLRLRRLALLAVAVCVVAALCGGALWAGSAPRTVAAHLLALLTGAALLAGFARFWPRASQEASTQPVGDVSMQPLHEAALAAGVRIFDWDPVEQRLNLDAARLMAYSAHARAALPDAMEFTRRIVHPEDLPRYRRELGKALKYKTHFVVGYRAYMADDVLKPVQVHAQIFRDANGQPTRVLGITVDMTPNAEAAGKIEQQARDYESALARLELASEFAGVGIWDWDLRSQRLDLDVHSAATLGFSGGKEIPSLPQFLQRVVHADDLGALDQALQSALQTETSLQHSFRLLHADGSLHHCQLRARIFRDQGPALRLLCVVVDTTQLVHAAEVLERKVEEERALVDRLNLATQVGGLGVWDWDISTDSVLLDPILAQAAGTGQLRVPSNARALFAAFVHPEDLSRYNTSLDAALASGDSFIQRYRVFHGEQIAHVQANGRIFRDAAGRAVRLLGVTRNITAEVHAAEQLKQQAEAERAFRERLDLATQTAGIAVWDMDPTTGAIVADQSIYQLFGVAPGATGQDMLDKIHVEDREALIATTQRVMSGGAEADTVAMRYRVHTTGERHFQTHIRAYRDGADRPQRLLGVTRDITDEVTHAAQLQILLDRFGVVMQAVKITPWELDASGKMVWAANRMKYDGLDEVPLEEYGARLKSLFDPADWAEAQAVALNAVMSGKNYYEHHFKLNFAGGVVRHMRSFAHIVRGPQGQYVRMIGATSDVTNDVQTTELLQRQAAQERALLDRLNVATQSAGICSWELDLLQREFLWVENPIKGTQGLTGDGKSASAFGQHVHPEDQGLFATLARQALAEGRNTISYRYRAFSNQGRLMHLQVHARLMADTDGRITRALGVSWEVTREVEIAEQLQQQAQRLQDAERRLERASLSSSEGHWESDLLQHRVWLSSSFHALLGYRDGELPTDAGSLQHLAHPDDAAAAHAALQGHLREGAAFNIDTRLRMRSGEYRWFRQRGAAERDATGQAVTMAGSIHDIHQQKLAEDALNLAQRRFERAINGTQDGLWELDADGAAWCSPRIAELLGHAPESFPSDSNFLRRFLHPDDASVVAAATQAHFQHELPYDVEIRLCTAAGEYRWYRARARAERDRQGRPLRLSGSLQDVTEARTAREELLRATQAAESANTAKSAFLANVSHEIRTPMNGIIGMTGLLLDTELDSTQRDFAETIRGSADSLLIIINDILDFSKIEAGKLDIEAIDMSLRDTVEEVGSMLALQAATRQLELIVHLHPQLPTRVIGDPQRIRQCLINLVGNAIKFTRSGEVVIEISHAGERDGHALARFEVRDTGIGIAPQTLATLFQPFVQADSSTTRHFGGTGLGLSIVRRLVEMMGGSVGVDSVVGTGSRFWFTLPLPATAVPQAPVPLTRLGKRVLVVDDNATARAAVTLQLSHAGYEATAAGSGAEALACLRQAVQEHHPFEILLADHQLPDMDAATLGQQLQAEQFSQARVIVLTSLDRRGDIARLAALGFAAHLTKPVRSAELFECLDRVLAHEASEWHLQSQPMLTRSALRGESRRRCHGQVLLVEDNPVNQKVAVRFLERIGCSVRVADNGVEGVKAFRDGRYDIVLMDLQMPLMDGLTATREIRMLEGSGPHTPIVALTANAMTGQLERCLEAGMNDFLSKPLELLRLREVLERHGMGADAQDAPDATPQSVTPIQAARWLELTGGDREFATALAEAFITSGRHELEDILAALGAFDRAALARAAHKLKGASANIHAERLRTLAHELETQSASVDQPRLKELVQRLQAEFDRAAEFTQGQMTAAVEMQAAG